MIKTVVLDANSLGEGLDLTIYKDFGSVEIHGFTQKEQVAERIKDADVILTNKIELNEGNLKDALSLKLICVTGTGSNHVDKVYTKSRGIVVSNVVGYSTENVTQHTFAMLFYLLEKSAFYDHYVRSKAYIGDQNFTHYQTQYHELQGKVWGIIGLGNIGSRVAELATAFRCKVQYYSTSGKNHSPLYPRVDLNTLLETSDIVSIHAPLNDQTSGLIGENELRRMKNSGILLNLGRGKIVNEKALAKVLDEDHLAGVGLDVLEAEPMSQESVLVRHLTNPKLYITPHVAWASLEARKRMVDEVYQNINGFLHGEKRNVVE